MCPTVYTLHKNSSVPSSTCTSDTDATGEERKIKTCNKLKEKQVMK